jgi:hypothetical protein
VQGRFTSPDLPFADQHTGDPQSWNLYSYTLNNPLRYTDPTGRGIFERFRNWRAGYGFRTDEQVQAEENRRREALIWIAQNEFGGIFPVINPQTGQIQDVAPLLNDLDRRSVWQLFDNYHNAPRVDISTLSEDQIRQLNEIVRPPSPALRGDPYHPDSVSERVRPPYRANPAHNPKDPLGRYNPRKTPEPPDAATVYQNSVRANMGTWYGRGSNGEIYRYFTDNAGGVHFSGIVPKSQVPKEVLKQLGL